MSALKIEIDPTQPLPEQYIGSDEDGPQYVPMTLYDAIVKTASDQLVKLCQEDIKHQIAETVVETITGEIDKRIPGMVEEALMAPLIVTDTWGKVTSTGSLHDLIVKHAKAQMTASEDRYGANKTALAKVVHEDLDYMLSHELSQAVKDARADLTNRQRSAASDVIAKTITDTLR